MSTYGKDMKITAKRAVLGVRKMNKVEFTYEQAKKTILLSYRN